MYRSRISYWSHSKLAEKIKSFFNVPCPDALPMEEWEAYEELYKDNLGYKISESFNTIQNIIYFPYDVYNNIRVYLVNRFVSKTHYLNTKLEKGKWHEFDERLLNGMFEEFIDFIEIEKASINWDYYGRNGIKKSWYDKWIENKNPEAGLEYLDWEINKCENKPQSESAKNQLKLYKWWKEVRPNRLDPYEISGWSEYCSTKDKTKYTKEQINLMLEEIQRLEKEYYNEDTEMMILLIQIRNGLWT